MKRILTVMSILAIVATPAFAQEGSQLVERNVYLYRDGALVHRQADEATHAIAMRMFKPMKAGSMVYFDKGRIYAAQDRKMPNGRMLSSRMLRE